MIGVSSGLLPGAVALHGRAALARCACAICAWTSWTAIDVAADVEVAVLRAEVLLRLQESIEHAGDLRQHVLERVDDAGLVLKGHRAT